jgi:hypothetical protein
MDAQFFTQLQETHVLSWNERNRLKRDDMLNTIYADSIKMYDPVFILNGIKEISDFIDKVQMDPQFDFVAVNSLEWVHNTARLFWSIKTEQGLLTGMDFFVLEEGKVAKLYVFMDK